MIAQATPPMPMTDETLADRARSGDLAAMDLLVRRWQSPLLAFLQRRVLSHADAEDLFQETFVRVQQNLHAYDARRPFRAWLFTIAWRLAANHRRDQRMRLRIEPLGEVAGGAMPPPEAMAQAESRENLWQAARRVLGPETSSLLWLFYVEEMPPREIASVTGRSWLSVKTALHRARRRLAEHLSRERVV